LSKIYSLLTYGCSEHEHRALKIAAFKKDMSLSAFLKMCIVIGYKTLMKESLTESVRRNAEETK
jgi:hypothetical protein